MIRHVALSGCSGGGKSTLLAELSRRGFATVLEPGRRIVEEEKSKGDGAALPWIDLAAFARRTIALAREDREQFTSSDRWVFFDRGLVDAVAALQYATGKPALRTLGPEDRYHHRVFLAPPWPEIYVKDGERRHGLAEAVAEYNRLLGAFGDLGYETIVLPKVCVGERADFVLGHLPLR